MTRRQFPHWLYSFVDYASHGEAPLQMYFWTGVSTIAGALQRKVWVDMGYFKWYANCFIILVAPPGIVAKSTTASIGMDILRQVPGVKFGPDVVTWQALVQSLANSGEAVDINGTFYPQSALTIESSEFGNLLNPADRDMVDLLITLWDGRDQFDKVTKTSGNDTIQGVWINIIACTTPAWIAGNFPEYMIGGGFMSRCIFVYAEKKRQFVAYPSRHLPDDIKEKRRRLITDLEHISQIKGKYELDEAAFAWGEAWYEQLQVNRPTQLDNERFRNYLARKQTHLHKVSMILAAAQRDERVILRADLMQADQLLSGLESAMPKVLGHVGLNENARLSNTLAELLGREGEMSYEEAFRHLYLSCKDPSQVAAAIDGASKAGLIKMIQTMGGMQLRVGRL